MPRWSETQLAMLREMGVHHFWPVEPPRHAGPTGVLPVEAPGVAASLAPTAVPSAAPQAPAAVVERSGSRSPMAAAAAPGSRNPPVPVPVPVMPAPALRHRPEGVAEMDWSALREAVSQCRACALCDGRRQPVFGAGHPQARWMLIGESPSEHDEQHDAPFADRSGQLLDRMLDASGLTRSDAPAEQQVYVANVIKCRPTDGRAPLPEEAAQCEQFLLRQVALVQPKVIVVMGRFAVQSLLKTQEAIGRLRGRTHEWHGVPLVVTFHPSYLLRNPADKALAWDDLCRARAVVQSLM